MDYFDLSKLYLAMRWKRSNPQVQW